MLLWMNTWDDRVLAVSDWTLLPDSGDISEYISYDKIGQFALSELEK